MFTTYKNQVEALIMLDDINNNLELRDVKFSGKHVLEPVEQILYLETQITDSDEVQTFWIGMKDAELVFADEAPEGVQLPATTV